MVVQGGEAVIANKVFGVRPATCHASLYKSTLVVLSPSQTLMQTTLSAWCTDVLMSYEYLTDHKSKALVAADIDPTPTQ